MALPPGAPRNEAEAEDAEPELSAADIGRRAASGAAMLTGRGVLGQVLGLASTIVVARLIEPNLLGTFAIAVTIATFLLVLGSNVGLGGALIRRPKAPERADLQACVALQLLVTTVLVAVVVIVALPLGLIGRLTVVMVVATPVTAFRSASYVVLERQLLYKRLASAESAEIVVYYVWTIVTVAIGWGVWGLATATVARTLVGAASIVAVAPTRVIWPRWDRKRIRAMLGIGLRVQGVDFVAPLRDQILVVGTGLLGGLSVVAYWSLVLRALKAPGMILWSLLRVSFPAMSRNAAAGGDPVVMLPRVLGATTVVAGTLLVPLAGSAPALVPFLFGDTWAPAVDALSLTCLAVVVHMPLVIAGQSYLWTYGDAKTPLRAMLADAVVSVAVGLSLVPFIGVLGLAIGGVAAAFVHTVILARAIDRETGIHVFGHLRAPVLAWVVAAGAGWVCAEGPGPLVVRVAVSCCVALGVYLGLLFLVRRELVLKLVRYSLSWIARGRREPAPNALSPSAGA